MKKQLALMTLSTFVAVGSFAGIGYAATETIDFELIAVGTPASSIGGPLVTIDSESMEVVEESAGPGTGFSSTLSYNSNVYGTNADGGQNWLPGDNLRSLGNPSTNRSLTGQNLTITFDPTIIVHRFSLDISDYGDWFPMGGSDPRQAALTAYDSANTQLTSDPLSIGYDVAANDVSEAGLITLEVSGDDIAYVELTFADVDPGVTFDNFSFDYEFLTEDVSLCAGQTMDVGKIQVRNDDTHLYVTYLINEPGVCMTETHLHVAGDPADIPQTKKGNPIPGKFEYMMDHNCVTEFTYPIPLVLDEGEELSIAAHAVVQVTSSGTDGACADAVFDYTQGTLYNGGVVGEDRSDPAKALGEPDSLRPLINFYSLGFDNPETAEVIEGVLSLSFPTFVTGEITVYETTYGPYPAEFADVSVSRDGADWNFLGTADNSGTEAEYHPSMFYLDGCYQYVKIVDMSVIESFSAFPTTAQAFDVDAVCASNTCNEETAWGGCFNDGSDLDEGGGSGLEKPYCRYSAIRALLTVL